jgi:hypothetical protein
VDKDAFEAWLNSPDSLYRRCTDPDCPDAYAYRHPYPSVPHYHLKEGDDDVHPV